MRTILAIPGVVLSFLTLLLMLLAMVPFLGWLNWINIPLAVVALLFCMLGRSTTGVTVSLVVILIGIFRLQIGCGII